MYIKNLFNKLKSIGKKQYHARNGEEELYFTNNLFAIEIFYGYGKLDIVINFCGKRSNYLESDLLTDDQKKQIEIAINAYMSLAEKCEIIQDVLLSINFELTDTTGTDCGRVRRRKV